jgi:hypothetical protein
VAWEKRGRRAYLYRSVRGADGDVRKVYLGHGPRAAYCERQHVAEQARCRADRDAAEALRADLEPLDRLASELDEGVDALVKAALRAAGFEQHDGSTLRRKRHGPETRDNPTLDDRGG